MPNEEVFSETEGVFNIIHVLKMLEITKLFAIINSIPHGPKCLRRPCDV